MRELKMESDCIRVSKYLLSLLVAFAFSSYCFSQQKNIPLNRFFSNEVERALLNQNVMNAHSGSKPYLQSRLDLSKVTGYAKDSIKVYEDYQDKLLRANLFCVKSKDRLLNSHLLKLEGDDFFITIDPLMDVGIGWDLADTSAYADTVNLWSNTRGLIVSGDLGDKFSFETGFYENQTFLPLYQKAFADSTSVIPGMGRWKAHKEVGYDYAMAFGLVSYTPKNWLNIQFGHGKNFIGHGYRSLLLSDASFNYPYLKSTIFLFDGKLQYSAIYASLQTLERLPLGEVPEALYKRKGGSFNYLSWLPNARIEVGLFEGIIWKRYDEAEGTQSQPLGGFIPVFGFGTATNGLNGENNVMLGANLKVKTSKHSFIYSQIALDDPARKAIGYQAGAKYFDLLLQNLDVQIEWNSLGDNMYASHYRLQSYSHINQPIGHPTGPATQEILGILNYRWHRVMFQVKYNQINHGTNPESSWRNDPLVVTNTIAPWPVKHVQQWDINAGFYLNPKTNLQILVGWTDRVEKIDYNWQPDFLQHTSMLYFTLRTNLINRYADF